MGGRDGGVPVGAVSGRDGTEEVPETDGTEGVPAVIGRGTEGVPVRTGGTEGVPRGKFNCSHNGLCGGREKVVL